MQKREDGAMSNSYFLCLSLDSEYLNFPLALTREK
jgi:hypothetical protein